jgi:hypothetical protein
MEKGWVLTSTKAVPSFSAVLKSAGNRFSIACLRRRGVIREASPVAGKQVTKKQMTISCL